MKKKLFLIPAVGCLLLFGGCGSIDSNTKDIKDSASGSILSDSERKNELDLDSKYKELENKVGLERIRSSDTLSDLSIESFEDDFIKRREKILKPELINEEVVLKCADRAVELTKLSTEDEKIYTAEFISNIDRLDYKMSRDLILELMDKLISYGDFEELIAREKDSDEVLVKCYIGKTLSNAIKENQDFSEEERYVISKVLLNSESVDDITSLLPPYNDVGTKEAMVDIVRERYNEGVELFKSMLSNS